MKSENMWSDSAQMRSQMRGSLFVLCITWLVMGVWVMAIGRARCGDEM